jgi:hypothetical protein
MQRGNAFRTIAISLRLIVQFLGIAFAALHYKSGPERMTELAAQIDAP